MAARCYWERRIRGSSPHTGCWGVTRLIAVCFASGERLIAGYSAGRLRAVTGDRGFESQENEDWLREQGVKRVVLPFRGKADRERRRYERQPWFRRLVCFRAGSEGRISLLKRVSGLDRSLMRGDHGPEIWVGLGILSHNLWQVARRA